MANPSLSPPGTGGKKAGKSGTAHAKKARGPRGRKKAPKKPRKKKKDKLQCGENGEYGKLKEKTGDNKFDRDHVPSKAALKEFARKMYAGRKLCPAQFEAVANSGLAIAIPKGVHSKHSPTYGGKNTKKRIRTDADNLKKAANRDTTAVKKGMKGKCKKRYERWANKVNGMTKSKYAERIQKAVGK